MMKQLEDNPNYQISDDGKVFSNIRNKFLSSFIDNLGYEQVILYNNGKRHYVRVHRLVAKYFVDNPFDLQYVNHKDGIKTHNDKSNLEWVDNSTNVQHAYDNNFYVNTDKQPLIVINKNTDIVHYYKSIRECASTLNLNRKTISSILKQEKKTNNYDYKFYYDRCNDYRNQINEGYYVFID